MDADFISFTSQVYTLPFLNRYTGQNTIGNNQTDDYDNVKSMIVHAFFRR